jgi:hypothetical protein
VATPPDADDTVLLPRPAPAGRRRLVWVTAASLVAIAAGAAAWVLWPLPATPPVVAALAPPVAPSVTPPVTLPAPPAAPTPAPVALAPVAPLAIAEIPADEATILANRTNGVTVFQFKPNPAILVLDFASMEQQGHMLNRVAALVEKAGQPRERVLNDTELAAAIHAAGATTATYYYGHDYRISDIARFFLLADSDEVTLTQDEQWLRALLRQQAGRLDGALALISIPQAGPEVDMASRAVILHHELSHGEYFSNLAYATYVHHFWHDVMREPERTQFRHWLANEGYDPALDDLIINETQAYLMHTHDDRFFTARSVGLAEDRMTQLQALFLLDMPPGWLRDCTTAPVAPPLAPVRAPATPVRAPRYRLAVSRTRASAARRTPRLRAVSMAA